MYTLLQTDRQEQLLELLNTLGPNDHVLAIYGMNGRHFAWVLKETKAVEPKKNKKGNMNGNS